MTEQHDGMIPLQGWDKVVEALVAYDSGLLSSSNATQNNLKDAIGQSEAGVVGLGLLAMATEKVASGNKFVNDLLSQAKKALEKQDRWQKHFDYDGMGTSFFKTTVEFEVIDREKQIFALGINAAYVGDKPEEDLAKFLGISRAIRGTAVLAQTEPLAGNRFSFDFEAILRKLDNVLDTTKLTGKQVVEAILKTDRPTFSITDSTGQIVELSPARVRSRFGYVGEKKVDSWKVDGATISGELDESYEHRGQKEPPSFRIRIYRRTADGWSNELIWKDAEKKAVKDLTDRIVQALS